MNTEDYIKKVIKNNLFIEVELTSPMSPGNDVKISLRFKGDDKPFADDVISIPEAT